MLYAALPGGSWQHFLIHGIGNLLFLALLPLLLRSVYQVLTYLPKFISTVVMTSLVTMLVKQGSLTTNMGILSQGLCSLGLISQEVANAGLLNNPSFFRAIYQISGIWETTGYDSIVFFAAIAIAIPVVRRILKLSREEELPQTFTKEEPQ